MRCGEAHLDSKSWKEEGQAAAMPTLLVVLQLRLLLPCHLSVAEDDLAIWHISMPAHVLA